MILGTNYKKNKFRRKYSESLYIKKNRSSINTHDKSVLLKLFNWVDSLVRPNQISEVKFFAKTAKVFKLLADFEKSFILDVSWFF